MNALANSPAGQPLSTVRRARWFLSGLHVALVAVAPVFVISGFEGDPGNPLSAALAALAIGALQLRHSFAAARDERPRGWPWTVAALIVLVYLPVVWFGMGWAPMQYFLIASAVMLLGGWPAAITVAAPLVGMAAAAASYGYGGVQRAFFAVYWIVGLATGAVALYGSARLVRVVDELYAARTELAELAIGRERLRVSRDLHDLLGHSLSAVSLKGDLARRLLHSDVQAARAEIEGLTEVARDALRDVRAVTRDEHAMSFRTETDGAALLLSAAGIDARIDVDLPELARPTEDVLAWAVREGVTNVLRHSDAQTCSVTGARRDGMMWLEIVNDGAHPATGGGSGLDGLTAAEQLYYRLPECRTLVLTGLSQPGNLLRALKVHVRGFIVKDAPAETLANGVRRVAAGERVIDPELVAAALETGSSPLTAREADVLHAAQSGIPTDQIASRLSLSPATMRNYLSNAISKVGGRNRIDAIRIARDAGWL